MNTLRITFLLLIAAVTTATLDLDPRRGLIPPQGHASAPAVEAADGVEAPAPDEALVFGRADDDPSIDDGPGAGGGYGK